LGYFVPKYPKKGQKYTKSENTPGNTRGIPNGVFNPGYFLSFLRSAAAVPEVMQAKNRSTLIGLRATAQAILADIILARAAQAARRAAPLLATRASVGETTGTHTTSAATVSPSASAAAAAAASSSSLEGGGEGDEHGGRGEKAEKKKRRNSKLEDQKVKLTVIGEDMHFKGLHEVNHLAITILAHVSHHQNSRPSQAATIKSRDKFATNHVSCACSTYKVYTP
jgi:hypothetical protein